MGCPESLWSLHLWRYSKRNWTQFWTAVLDPAWTGGLVQAISRGPFHSNLCAGSLKYAASQDRFFRSCKCSAPLFENKGNCAVPSLVLNLVLRILDAKSTSLKMICNVLKYVSSDSRLFQMFSVPESCTAPPDILFAFLFFSENVKT